MMQLVILPLAYAFSYGLLHTLQPCEDKAIFGFHAFGVAKHTMEAMKLVGIYALGLLSINNFFGFIFSLAGTALSLNENVELLLKYISPIVTIILGIVLLYRLIAFGKQDDHYAIPETFKVKKKKLPIFLLGVITGLPPCPFELAIYIEAFRASTGYFFNGIAYVFLFSIGTVIGLFILALVLRSMRLLDFMKGNRRDVIQKFISSLLIVFGVINLLLTIAGISLFPEPPPIEEL
ncbi:hypothetical protein GF325_17515 [Candidatus Bathyarchaeota archaeon]|nr:hypothetical protein [Candidatus Bathyarchaeota archaeon]